MHKPIRHLSVALTLVVGGVLAPTPSATAAPWVEQAERRLNRLDCNAGRVDGRIDAHTRAGIVRFQSANGMVQSGRFTEATRKRLRSDRARDCARRPVPARSGTGRRIVLSQRQNWVWLVRAGGRVVAQGGIVDNPSALSTGRYLSGPKCGRAGRIKYNSDGGDLVLYNFVRFAACGVGFHQVPYYRGSRQQIHPDWLLGTNHRESHGCIRVSRPLSERIWDFTVDSTRVVVVRG